MIRHYLKVIWNRKRANVLIAFEIFLSFLVVFAVVTLGIHYADSWRQPLGFSYHDVWNVQINMRTANFEGGDQKIPAALLESYSQLLRAVRELPEVVEVAAATCPPYGHSHWTNGSDINGWRLRFGMNHATDAFASVMGLEITRGRWFDRRDDGANWQPAVINEALAAEIFGAKNPIGNAIPREKPRAGAAPDPEMRIVGVIRDFRQDGEIPSSDGSANYLIVRHLLDDTERRPPENLLIKVKPGTTVAFEEKLIKHMQAVARDWSFEIEPLEQMRESWINEKLAPLIAAGVIAGFLVLMVGMGLTGVLWQTVTQRTHEIGLRRAKGATLGDIRAQILGELVVLTSVALVAGAALVLQFPLLKLMDFVSPRLYAGSLVISALGIYLLTIACAWYPSRLAARIQPAEALHYE
jgi:putative ABC transport system permease protein